MTEQQNTEKAGGTRFSTGKPGLWWAVPLYGLRLVARVTMYGAKKYAPQDWRSGQSFSTLIDCAYRHMLEVLTQGPWARDPESGEYHMAHVGWNVLALLHFMELGRTDLDDVTPWTGITTKARADLGLNLTSPASKLWEAHKGPLLTQSTQSDKAREARAALVSDGRW